MKESIQNLLEDADLVHEVHISKELVKEIDINFSDKMVIEAFKQLKEYEKDIKGIISLVGVDTEFEIYSGNFTIAKENVKAFGKNRVLAVTRQIRFKHFDKFFGGLPLNDLDAYKEGHEKVLNNEEFFSRETLDKCIFYYLVSYIMKFPNVKFEEPVEKKSAFEKLKKQVDNASKLLGYFKPENNYFGFVWFVVPKIMISQKVRSRQQTEREANKQIP